jgi:hypothetical protein
MFSSIETWTSYAQKNNLLDLFDQCISRADTDVFDLHQRLLTDERNQRCKPGSDTSN